MKAGILSFTDEGERLASRVMKFFMSKGMETESARCLRGELKEKSERLFRSKGLLIFVGSCGLAVRAVAPYLESKDKDPAVLVIDERAQFVISLLSGHLGGANAYARMVAEFLNARPVITTASDARGLFSVDDWARKAGLLIADTSKIVNFASAYLAGSEQLLYSDFPIVSSLPPRVRQTSSREKADLAVVTRLTDNAQSLEMIPRCFSLGIGCRKGTPYTTIERAISDFLAENGLPAACIARLASVDLKAGEEGLIRYAREAKIPFVSFSAERLREVQGSESRSDFVRSVTGVDNVCERSALAAFDGARLLVPKTILESVTLALAIAPFELDFTI